MKETKILKAGENVSVRIPVNTSQEILDYINKPRAIKRNKHLSNLLFSKIEEEIRDEGSKITLSLPFQVTNEQRNMIENHLKTVFSILAKENPEIANSEKAEGSIINVDELDLDGLLLDDDDD
ncbi:hypothetical protein E2329_23040 [Salmonella enterica subsp. enterica]|nr:hypothetical protein [Salmonella enterica subsp. enterica serovar Paratyphi A]